MSVLLFDIDNTLLDTGSVVNQGFKPALQSELGLTQTEFDSANETYWSSLTDSTDFDPQAYTSFLATRFNHDHQVLLDIIYTPKWYLESIFPEVRETLALLQQTHTLGIFSQGNREYQRRKLELCQLISFFSPAHLYIRERKTAPKEIDELPESIIVDDRLAVITILQDHPQITPIWLNRNKEHAEIKGLEIQSLSHLQQILTTL